MSTKVSDAMTESDAILSLTLAKAIAKTDAVAGVTVVRISDRGSSLFSFEYGNAPVTGNHAYIQSSYGAFHWELQDKFNAEGWGAVNDSGLSIDSSSALNAAGVYARSIVNNIDFKLVGEGVYFIDSDVNLRDTGLDFSGVNMACGTNAELILGGNSSNGYAPKQLLSRSYRVGEPTNTPIPNKPIIRIVGSKGQNIEVGFCPHIMVYANTNSDVNSTDSSTAYSAFKFDFTHRLHLTNNPSTDGTLTQWINENTFDLKRTVDLIVDGTYNHNNNIFNTGDFEGASTINFTTGSSNTVTNARFENNTVGINFGSGTWGNKICISWESNWRAAYEDFTGSVSVSDLGRGNSVFRSSDYKLRNVDLFSLSNGTANSFADGTRPITTLKNFFAQPGDFGSYNIGGAFRSILLTDLIPVDRNDSLSFNSDAGNNLRVFWRCFDLNKMPITPVDLTNVGTDANTKTVANNSITQGSNIGSSLIVVLDDTVKYIQASVISGSGVSSLDFNRMTISSKGQFNKVNKLSSGCLMSYQNAGATSVPTKGFAQYGVVVENILNSSYYKCTFSLQAIAQSGSGTSIVLDTVSGVQAGDVIGVLQSGGTVWTTVSSVSSNTVGLNSSVNSIIAGQVVTINRWITVTP